MSACSMNALPRAKPAICNTSQPLHTGFSTGTGGNNIGDDASGTRGTSPSLFGNGCSNCGFSEDDKNILCIGLSVSSGPVYGIHRKYSVWARLSVLKSPFIKTFLGFTKRVK